MLYVVIIILETKISNWQLLYASIFVCFYCWFQAKIRTKRNGKTKKHFQEHFRTLLACLNYFTFRRFILLVQLKKVISMATAKAAENHGNGWGKISFFEEVLLGKREQWRIQILGVRGVDQYTQRTHEGATMVGSKQRNFQNLYCKNALPGSVCS